MAIDPLDIEDAVHNSGSTSAGVFDGGEINAVKAKLNELIEAQNSSNEMFEQLTSNLKTLLIQFKAGQAFENTMTEDEINNGL